MVKVAQGEWILIQKNQIIHEFELLIIQRKKSERIANRGFSI